jgi:hypothetical protein
MGYLGGSDEMSKPLRIDARPPIKITKIEIITSSFGQPRIVATGVLDNRRRTVSNNSEVRIETRVVSDKCRAFLDEMVGMLEGTPDYEVEK